jgi:dihydroorotate dehydrogenase (NAD+) catalytic subunit
LLRIENRVTLGATKLPIARAMPLRGYNWRETYDWNYDNVPEPQAITELALRRKWDYCGLPVSSPIGIAAGPLLNGQWILYYASLGFEVLTYKTVRSSERACYALPNLQPVQAGSLRVGGNTLSTATQMRDGWAVSFGMPSRAPQIWRSDIEQTRSRLPKDKILSVSVVASPQPQWTIDDLAADFALCARWAIESGADCVEANFSCPNVASVDAQLFQQPEAAAFVAARLRETIGSKPLLIKIGHIADEQLAARLVHALTPHVNALVMVNCIPAKIVDQAQRPLFHGETRGIAGAPIYEAALAQIHCFNQIVRAQGSSLRLVGVGGIATFAQLQAHLQAGSHSVQLATAAMLNPLIGQQMHRNLVG